MRQPLTASLTGLGLFCLLCLLPVGCSQQESSPVAEQQNAGLTTLTIGLIPEQNIFAQKKRYEPLLAYLAKQLDVAIEIRILPRYGNIIDNFNELGLDGAFFGSFTGALAIDKLGVEPLARPQYLNGSSTYYGMVFIRKDSGIRTARDMQGKRMVFVDRATTAGYLLPLSFFRTIGIENYTTWFDKYYFSGTHEDAINDVLNGFADIGAAKDTVFYRMAASDTRIARDLEILATSPHVPANGLAVRHDLPDSLKQALQQQLLTLHQNDQGRQILKILEVGKFLKTSREDYQPVFDYATAIGLDLKTYNYLND
ncbi:MAG: phosphate/phosphite/phosphonate ABC transporter substrate-binding protein [Desulfuromonadales bacterium]|nr:phosphate/phosphite/phosphonate ABC transporter substrate-binding protein [Desulfuromonadales bacterium]